MLHTLFCFASGQSLLFGGGICVTCCAVDLCVSVNKPFMNERLRLIWYELIILRDSRQFGKSIFQYHFQEIVEKLLVETLVLKCVQNLQRALSSILVPQKLVKDIWDVCYEQISNFHPVKNVHVLESNLKI